MRVERDIDQGGADRHQALSDVLRGQKTEIEHDVGEPLEGERLGDRRASRMAVYRDGKGDPPDDRLAEMRCAERGGDFALLANDDLQKPPNGRLLAWPIRMACYTSSGWFGHMRA